MELHWVNTAFIFLQWNDIFNPSKSTCEHLSFPYRHTQCDKHKVNRCPEYLSLSTVSHCMGWQSSPPAVLSLFSEPYDILHTVYGRIFLNNHIHSTMYIISTQSKEQALYRWQLRFRVLNSWDPKISTFIRDISMSNKAYVIDLFNYI